MGLGPREVSPAFSATEPNDRRPRRLAEDPTVEAKKSPRADGGGLDQTGLTPAATMKSQTGGRRRGVRCLAQMSRARI